MGVRIGMPLDDAEVQRHAFRSAVEQVEEIRAVVCIKRGVDVGQRAAVGAGVFLVDLVETHQAHMRVGQWRIAELGARRVVERLQQQFINAAHGMRTGREVGLLVHRSCLDISGFWARLQVPVATDRRGARSHLSQR